MTLSREEEDKLILSMRDTLYTAVVSDVLDTQGYLHQAMSARVRPIDPAMRVVGRAHTALTAEVFQRNKEPYKLEIASVDSLKPGDVMVAATGNSQRTCFWGELLSTAAVARGATGCVIDGHVRDVIKIIAMEFPVFATGIRPVDSSYRSTVIDYECPVECAGVVVNEGDIVFADFDGVVVVPRVILAETVAAAEEKVAGEDHARVMLKEGALLREVFDQFGVL